MLKRFKLGTGAVLGLIALALGGSALAGASSSATHATKASLVSTAAPEPKATGPDTDNIQSGDQSTPDSAKAAKASTASASGTSESPSPESGTGESSSRSDGPGGHADPAGNVENQQQGQN